MSRGPDPAGAASGGPIPRARPARYSLDFAMQ